MKKIIALVLAIVTVLSLCAACTDGGSEGGKKPNSGASAENVTLTIGLPTNALVLDYKNNALTKYLEAETGYNLEFQVYSGGADIATQISTTVAANQELPDIIFDINLGDGVITRYGDDGYFIDLQDYFADKDGASKVFWDRIAENLSEEEQADVIRKMTEPETGAIYAVPTMETSLVDILDYQVWINTEWLDAVGMEAPTDLDSLYKVLVAFKTKDPNGNGKADELPLFGSESAGLGADVINWLMNQFLYLDDRKPWSVDENGKLYAPYITDEYREGLKFINKLIDEGLMQDSCFTTSSSDMKRITTPASNTALCGIFVGHLTLHAAENNEVLYQYEPLAPLKEQYCVYNDNTFRRNMFITADCENPDAAFNLLMTKWTEEASIRTRYGEYNVNWTDADEGAVSPLGLPATIKLLKDPLGTQNTCMWSSAAGSLNVYAEGEAAQLAEEQTEWLKYRNGLAAQSRKNYDAAAETNNPKEIVSTLIYTEMEKETTEVQRTAVSDYWKKTRTDFCKGVLNPESDTDWNTYVKKVQDLGLETYQQLAQKAYDRQK